MSVLKKHITCTDTCRSIFSGTWMVVDINFPSYIKTLEIEGTLEVEYNTGIDFVLKSTYIVVTGRFIIGWANNPFPDNIEIELVGDISTEEYVVPLATPLGAKVIGKIDSFDFILLTIFN